MNQRIDQSQSTQRAGSGAGQEGSRTYTAYQRHLLEKIERMRRNRREYHYRPDAEEWILKAMDRSIYSAFLDCLNEGLGREAKSIVADGEGVRRGQGDEHPASR